MSSIIRKNCWKFHFFLGKSSLELTEGWLESKLIAYPIEYIQKKNLVVFGSPTELSFFQKKCEFNIFRDYANAHNVTGYDVIGHPLIQTDNFGLDLSDVENRLTIHGLHKMLWLNKNGLFFGSITMINHIFYSGY